jgi:hypothetical protein
VGAFEDPKHPIIKEKENEKQSQHSVAKQRRNRGEHRQLNMGNHGMAVYFSCCFIMIS